MTDLTHRITKLRFITAEEVREKGRYRKICVEAEPMCAIIRLVGLRTAYSIPWAAIHSLAVKAAVAAEKAEKAAKKKAGRNGTAR
jgi:hypothetical protein